jgi:hypothetical protein
VEKPIGEFNLDRGRSIARCKSCKSLENKRWREANKDKIKKRNKELWNTRKNNPIYNEKQKTYYKNNREVLLLQKKEYYQKNKKEILAYHKKYERIQLKTNPIFRLRKNVRRRLHLALKGAYKPDTTRNIVGCDWNVLKEHLESLFKDGMSWENYGYYGWHVDHIIPLSEFDLNDPEQFKKAMHYTNLQPLWMEDNLAKKNLR